MVAVWAFMGLAHLSFTQGYTHWLVGDTADYVSTTFQPGIVLAGGGTDNDQAMIWMLERAGGGDVVVIRASNSDGYNDYFYSELGVSVHSVETIRFDAAAAAYDPYVLRQISQAEVLFIAGGDQYDYYELWKDTPVEDTLNYLIQEKGITVGGTSAGMAILSGAYYTPNVGSLTSAQALSNPFHANVDILGWGDFIHAPLLENTVTDTHYDQRTRRGRHVTFLARLIHDFGFLPQGIACNEFTAVCIDENGIAHVFGEYPQYDDFAYFLKSNCQEEFNPEIIQAGVPLTWNRQQAAVKVYKAPGRIDGATTFDLHDWENGSGGAWEDWYVEDGELMEVLQTNGDCASVNTAFNPLTQVSIRVYPNPFSRWLYVDQGDGHAEQISLRLSNLLGNSVWQGHFAGRQIPLDMGNLPGGAYWLEVNSGTSLNVFKVIKK